MDNTNILPINFETYYNTNMSNIEYFIFNIDDIVIMDSATFSTIIQFLEKIYANNLALLFLMSCLSSLYVCSYTRRKKDFIMINNVEPKLLKDEQLVKV
jgi:hypothetical protein